MEHSSETLEALISTAVLNTYTPFLITKLHCGYTFCRLYPLDYVTFDTIYEELSSWALKPVRLFLDEQGLTELPRGAERFKTLIARNMIHCAYPPPARVAYNLYLDDGHTHCAEN